MTTFWDGPHSDTAFEDVDWASLTHAYGPADDVPGQLAALRSGEQAVRDTAYWRLYGNVFHQGDRYAATPYAARHLISVAADPATPERHRALGLLARLAIGYDDAYLPRGFDAGLLRAEAARIAALDPEQARRELAEWVAEAPNEDIARNRAYHLEVFDVAHERDAVRWALESYDAVRAGTAVYRALLEDPSPAVRIGAAYLLGWFPEDAARSVSALVEVLRSETHPPVAATAAVAAALLGGGPAVARWAEAALADPAEVVAWAGAVVLALRYAGTGPGAVRVYPASLDDEALHERVIAVLRAHIADAPDLPDAPGGEDLDDVVGEFEDYVPQPEGDAGSRVPYLDGDLAGLAMGALELLGEDGCDDGREEAGLGG
ncbi:HEAT repeat domain-containing protein [Yinghuangia seranimata]|uniref:HEAT repeat domain-containing protein n=1 Tax=Yinghuangia seranimata TaxID=408067 RepID=UPI00248B3506|nr:HEAT repeat domain-containing protein [Yinghuangia seranimata]MDI2127640.1 HEAT repeat domain-containing protein [Yinghuangia seranimata]